MTIVFICGSLEHGKDGVGDYTRRLSAELLRQNHRVSIIAIHDRHLPESTVATTQPEQEQRISVLRLSSQLSWKERALRANEHINATNPDWISIQYVPFSFHDRGLSVKLAGVLKKIVADRPMHIMFHELWLGLSKQSPKKHILWGVAQRLLISYLLKVCHSPVIHTHTFLYQNQLRNLNVKASILPLFSNIPVTSSALKRENNNIDKSIRFIVFGGISPNAPIEQLAAEAADYALRYKKVVELVFVGRNGSEKNRWIYAWRSKGLAAFTIGEQSPEQISNALSDSSIGLSTTPIALAGKSGSIAAMHTHGLAVICISAPWIPRKDVFLPETPGVTDYSSGHLENILNHQQEIKVQDNNLYSVASQYIKDLS